MAPFDFTHPDGASSSDSICCLHNLSGLLNMLSLLEPQDPLLAIALLVLAGISSAETHGTHHA